MGSVTPEAHFFNFFFFFAIMNHRRFLHYLTFVFLFFTLPVSPTFSKTTSSRSGGFSSGSRSSGSSGGWGGGKSSTPKVAPRPSPAPSKPTTSTSGNGWAGTPTKKPSAPQPPPKPIVKSASGKTVDSAAYEKAVKSGKAFKSRDEALNDFKQKKSAEYKNSFDKEPTTRPSYIPQKTNVGGVDYNVSYNPNTHSYGYYGAGGGWNAFDVFRDVALISLLMDKDDYVVVQQPPASSGNSGQSQQIANNDNNDGGIGAFGWTMIGIVSLITIGVGAFFIFGSKF